MRIAHQFLTEGDNRRDELKAKRYKGNKHKKQSESDPPS